MGISLRLFIQFVITGAVLFTPFYSSASVVKDQSQFTTNYSKIDQSFMRALRPMTQPINVQKIIDGVSFLSTDNQIYRLSGIDIPIGDDETGRQAQAALQRLIEGKTIKAYITKKTDKGRTNRMGQNLIHAVTKDNVWVQAYLLENGLARVMTTPSNPELAKDMLNRETLARNAKKQLWGNDNSKLISSDEASGYLNSFQIIEGVITSSATIRNQLYLNFGIKGQNDWRKDFTIGVSPALRKSLARQKINLMEMQGAHVRVRGWVESYNGPYINLTHAEQLEILKAGRALASGAIERPRVQTPKIEKPEMPKIMPQAVTREEITPNE